MEDLPLDGPCGIIVDHDKLVAMEDSYPRCSEDMLALLDWCSEVDRVDIDCDRLVEVLDVHSIHDVVVVRVDVGVAIEYGAYEELVVGDRMAGYREKEEKSQRQ